MTQFVAFFKKEVLEFFRSGKCMVMAIIFTVFGIMNPAFAKLTPWLMEMAAESLEGSGIVVTDVPLDAMTSWTQYYKNVPLMMVIVFIMFSGIFTGEYQKGTLINMLTKGLVRHNVVLAKLMLMLSVWTVGYFWCFGITYAYNEYYWDNSIAQNLFFGVMCIYVLGIWLISLITLTSVLFDNSTSVMLTTGVVFIAMYLLSIIPKIAKYLPVSLINSGELLSGSGQIDNYVAMLIVSGVLIVVNIMLAVVTFNRKVFR